MRMGFADPGAKWLASMAVLGLLLTGCSPPAKAPAPEPKRADRRSTVATWSVDCQDPTETEPALLWNGLIGLRISRTATAGDPALPMFLVSEYDREGEEKIRALPNPLRVEWTIGDHTLGRGQLTNYRQTLDLKTGILDTRWREKNLHVECETVLDPAAAVVAQRWKVHSDLDAKAQVVSGLAGAGLDWRGPIAGTKAFFAHKLTGAASGAWAEENDAHVWRGTLDAGEQVIFDRVGSFGARASRASFEDLRRASVLAWQNKWATDIQIEGPDEDQQAIRSFLFYLRSSIHPFGGMSVAPCGLSNAQYAGHIFWDADVWVLPPLLFLDPKAARAIATYRLAKLPTAQANFAQWAKTRPTGKAPLGPLANPGSGAKFPWESSVTGRETVPGPSRFQDHISGSVLWSLERAAAAGLIPWSEVQKAGRLVAGFYQARTQNLGGKLQLNGTMSPDENHVGDNDLYTNLLAGHAVAKYGTTGRKSPLEAGRQDWLYLPQDQDGLLAYDNDRLRGYKQAAAVLSIFPLQYPEAEAQAEAMMARFEDKVTPNGPAMTDAIHATIWARAGKPQKAYEEWRRGWRDFTDLPLLLFSEKRRKAVAYFTTGAAGALQTVLYGFLGLRIDASKPTGAAWSTPLEGGYWLSAKANLPPAWKGVTIRGLRVGDRSLDLVATPSGVKVRESQPRPAR